MNRQTQQWLGEQYFSFCKKSTAVQHKCSLLRGESSSPEHHCGMKQNNSKQAEKSSDRKDEQRGSHKNVYSVVMSLRARSSSSLRALPFSFWAYTSSGGGHTATQSRNRADRQTHRVETVKYNEKESKSESTGKSQTERAQLTGVNVNTSSGYCSSPSTSDTFHLEGHSAKQCTVITVVSRLGSFQINSSTLK